MRIFRLVTLSAVMVLAGLALIAGQASTSSTTGTPGQPSPVAAAAPTPRPTRIPLPTAAPPVIISRLARETATPRPTPTPSSEPDVAVVDNGYAPSELDVRPGVSVLWTNLGGDGHDITGTGPDGVWRSGPLGPRETYHRSFTRAGVYDYVCTVHPEMRGRVTVVQP
ncbi:MAG: hypothetical protein NVSMB2_00080 [Chloroflexota bacterium]